MTARPRRWRRILLLVAGVGVVAVWYLRRDRDDGAGQPSRSTPPAPAPPTPPPRTSPGARPSGGGDSAGVVPPPQPEQPQATDPTQRRPSTGGRVAAAPHATTTTPALVAAAWPAPRKAAPREDASGPGPTATRPDRPGRVERRAVRRNRTARALLVTTVVILAAGAWIAIARF